MTGSSITHSALYRTIMNQPEIIRSVLDTTEEEITSAAALLSGARRIVLAGTGTSSHAAIVGEHLLRLAGADAYATTHFDFVTYPRPLDSDDVLIAISHRGTKRYGTRAIERARAEGIRVIGLTGQGSPMDGPDIVIPTAPREQSATHTASYTATLTALALLAIALGEKNGADVGELRAGVGALPEIVAALLARKDEIRITAAALAARGRLTLIGAGPNAATAREGALKVKESSYLVAEGFELETALHGGLQAIERDDVTVVIAAHGPALERTFDLIRALRIIGTRLMIVADERVVGALPVQDAPSPSAVVTYAAVPEPLSPIPAVVPLQVLAALTAGLRGTNPDSFRADDPIYKQANESYTL